MNHSKNVLKVSSLSSPAALNLCAQVCFSLLQHLSLPPSFSLNLLMCVCVFLSFQHTCFPKCFTMKLILQFIWVNGRLFCMVTNRTGVQLNHM